MCTRRASPRKTPTPRICKECGELRLHAAHGLCGRCWQRHPDRPFAYASGLRSRLAYPPTWLEGFAAHAGVRFCPGRVVHLLRALGRLLSSGAKTPTALLEEACLPGRSAGPLARTLESFFVETGLALPLDHAERLARGRRRRRIEAVAPPFRVAVAAFAQSEIDARSRARRARTRPRSDACIEARLDALRDFGRHLLRHRPAMTGWELVSITDVDAFLAGAPTMRCSRLGHLRAFFRWARGRRLVLTDPTRGIPTNAPRGFRSEVVEPVRQRALFHRWTTEAVHPHEAFVGLAALVHGASSGELRGLTVGDVDRHARSIRLGRRPSSLALDPATWIALEACLAHRDGLRTVNPHVIVTKITATGERAASISYIGHVLDPAPATPKRLRWTRLAHLVQAMDPKLVADAFGLTSGGPLHYLADTVDRTRLENL